MQQNHHLIADHLSAGYGEKTILNDVTLHIPHQKISVILGSNGSGKSTLLKTFCRLLSPTEGNIMLDGKSLPTMKSKDIARTIGLLPQSSVAPEGIKVAELVSRGRFPYRKFMSPLTSEDYAAIEEAMAAMEITDLADRSIEELSGGQRQRVFIALALAQQTDILFLDEPTTYLDIAYQIEILDLLKELNHCKHTTIVMVLHDINLSSKYADYIFAMKNGHLIKEGTPEEIITADTIHDIYGINSLVIPDPLSKSPFVIPISSHDAAKGIS
ncbi:MAG: ABC transporter ATP-binding protein [Lachnospiraceae bacterium]|nr:ABC transporter ATP-binding protein [Lachnospiraceae bacterium]